MSATIRDDRSYKIDPHGNPCWRIVRRYNGYGCRMVEVHNAALAHLTHDGKAAIARCPESYLILADASHTSASAAGGETDADYQAQRSAPAAESAPEVTAHGNGVDGSSPVVESSGAPNRSGGSDKAAAPSLKPHGTPAVPDVPAARATDPQPAHDAARTAKALASERRIICLLAHEAAGDNGLTGDELEIATNLDYEVIGPRRPWLETNGFVAPNGKRRRNRKLNSEGVYVITEAGREMCARLRAEGKVAA